MESGWTRHLTEALGRCRPGADEREFWERVEERNKGTAATLDRLGLPAYFAIEAYVVERDGRPVESPATPTSSLAAEAPERSGDAGSTERK